MTNRYIEALKEALKDEIDAARRDETLFEADMRQEYHRMYRNLILYGNLDGYDALSDELKARVHPDFIPESSDQ